MLPTMGSEEPGMPGSAVQGKNKRQGMVKVLVDNVRDSIGELSRMAGYGRRERDF